MSTQEKTENLAAKIVTLERRADHLEQRMANGWTKPTAISYELAELSALRTAIVCMRLKYAEAEKLDQPLKVLKELVELLERRGDGRIKVRDSELSDLLDRASAVLTDFAEPAA